MKIQNNNGIITRIAGTKHHTFNVPDIGDRVILISVSKKTTVF